MQADGTTVSFARDGQKSIRAEVNSTGAVTNSFRYTAYGDLQAASPTAANPTFLGYNSQLRDNSGLLYLRARWYDPASARFITRDPLLGSPAAPATLNAFGYGGGNPLMMSDPSGMAIERDQDGPAPEDADDDLSIVRGGGAGGAAPPGGDQGVALDGAAVGGSRFFRAYELRSKSRFSWESLGTSILVERRFQDLAAAAVRMQI